MPRDAAPTAAVHPSKVLKLFGSLGALPRNPRTMLTYDASLAWTGILLLATGVVMVYSASIVMAEASPHTGFRAWYFLVRHALFVGVGIVAAYIAFQVPMKVWQQLAPWLFIGGAVLLVLVLIPGIGKSVNGSRRWLSLGFVNLQPSEFMKLTVVLYAASYAVRKAAFLHAEQPLRQTLLRGFLPLFAVMVAIGGLLLLEPDFGAFVVIVAIAFGILFLGGLDWRLFIGLLVLLPFGLAAILVAAPYRLQRLIAFLDPWSDPFGKGYQLSHSLIAFGRGEWTGVGL
jgi:cell division protein FtsW